MITHTNTTKKCPDVCPPEPAALCCSCPGEELLRSQCVEESESQAGGQRHRSQQEDERHGAGKTRMRSSSISTVQKHEHDVQ